MKFLYVIRPGHHELNQGFYLPNQPESHQKSRVAGNANPELTGLGKFQTELIASDFMEHAGNHGISNAIIYTQQNENIRPFLERFSFIENFLTDDGPKIHHARKSFLNQRGLGPVIQGVLMQDAKAIINEQNFHFSYNPESRLYLRIEREHGKEGDGSSQRAYLQTSTTAQAGLGQPIAPKDFDFSKDALQFEPAHMFCDGIGAAMQEVWHRSRQYDAAVLYVRTLTLDVIAKYHLGYTPPEKVSSGTINVFEVDSSSIDDWSDPTRVNYIEPLGLDDDRHPKLKHIETLSGAALNNAVPRYLEHLEHYEAIR